VPVQAIQHSMPGQAVRFLQDQSARLASQIRVPRPWHYAELHNPWARSAALYDSWGFLDLCQSPALLEAVAGQIGEDIILFDSQWLPQLRQPPAGEVALESDVHRFPVDPPRGITVLIAFTDSPAATLQQQGMSYELSPRSVTLVDAQVPYRVDSCSPDGLPPVFAARYFPATSRYLRDPAVLLHRALTERYPLFDYARMPLWLVRGEDRAQNDFVTGFNPRAGYWSGTAR
jgi:hypothetical protein